MTTIQNKQTIEESNNHTITAKGCTQILSRFHNYDDQKKVNTARQKRFQGWEKIKITSDSGIEKEAIAPVIISATRRSDSHTYRRSATVCDPVVMDR